MILFSIIIERAILYLVPERLDVEMSQLACGRFLFRELDALGHLIPTEVLLSPLLKHCDIRWFNEQTLTDIVYFIPGLLGLKL